MFERVHGLVVSSLTFVILLPFMADISSVYSLILYSASFVLTFLIGAISTLALSSSLLTILYSLYILIFEMSMHDVGVQSILLIFQLVLGSIVGQVLQTIFSRNFYDDLLFSIKHKRLSINYKILMLSISGFWLSLLLGSFLHLILLIPIYIVTLILLIAIDIQPIAFIPLLLSSPASLPYIVQQTYPQEKRGPLLVQGVAVKGFGMEYFKTKTRKARWRPYKTYIGSNQLLGNNYNIAIIGSSGSGKSTLAKILFRNMNKSYVIIDAHGEYMNNETGGDRVVLSRELPFNPFSLFGMSYQDRSIQLANILSSVFNLGDLQMITLTSLISELYESKGCDTPTENCSELPTFKELRELIDIRIRSSNNSQELSVLQRLRPYIEFLERNISIIDNNVNILNSKVVFDISKLPSDELKYLAIEVTLRQVLYEMYSSGPSELRTLILLEEAPFLLSRKAGREVISRLMAEGRKYGIGTVLVSQYIEPIKEFVNNIDTLATFSINEPNELDYASRIYSLGSAEIQELIRQTLPRLARGEAVLRLKHRDEVLLSTTVA